MLSKHFGLLIIKIIKFFKILISNLSIDHLVPSKPKHFKKAKNEIVELNKSNPVLSYWHTFKKVVDKIFGDFEAEALHSPYLNSTQFFPYLKINFSTIKAAWSFDEVIKTFQYLKVKSQKNLKIQLFSKKIQKS